MSLTKFLKSVGKDEVLLPVLRDYMKNRVALEEAGKLSRKDITQADARLTIKCYETRIEEFNHGEEIPGEYFHPSALGQCFRKVFFQIKDAPQDRKKPGDIGDELLRMHFTFETGTLLHVIVQNLCELAGILVKREVPIQDEKRKILGHCDGVVRIGEVKYALEIKSINSAGFTRTTAPKHEHKAQVFAYLRSLGIKKAIVLYVNKDTGQCKEFVLDYDHDFYLEHVFRRIRKFFRLLDKNILPAREGENPRGFPCVYCPYTRICFESGYAERWKKTLTKAQIAKKH